MKWARGPCELLFSVENRLRYMNLTLAFLNIPQQAGDSAFARQYNTVGSRGVTLKPGPDGKLHVYIGVHKLAQGEKVE